MAHRISNLEREARNASISVYVQAQIRAVLDPGLSLEDLTLVAAGATYDLFYGWGQQCSLRHAAETGVHELACLLQERQQLSQEVWARINAAVLL